MKAIKVDHLPDWLPDWPELISLDDPDLPSVSAELLPTWAGEFAKALTAETETPPELAVSLVLGTCAAAVARHTRVQVHSGYSEPTNLWLAVALPPGSRKSAVQKKATSPLMQWERDQADAMAAEIRSTSAKAKSIDARVAELRKQAGREKDPVKWLSLSEQADVLEATKPDVPVPPKLWTSNATQESLGIVLMQHGERLAWLSSEGGIFDILAGLYSGGALNLDLVLKSHSGDPDRVDRVSREAVFLVCPLMTVALSPQPDVLRGLGGTKGLRGRGLLARFCYFVPRSNLGFRTLEPHPMPPAVATQFEQGVFALLNLREHGVDADHPNGKPLLLNEDALAHWKEFAAAIEAGMRPGGDFANSADWAGKCPGLAIRIAGVLHMILHAHDRDPWAHPISGETMKAALKITAIGAKHSLYAMDMMGADDGLNDARKVLEWIRREKRSPFSLRDTFEGLKGTFHKMDRLRAAAAILEERGYIQIKKPEASGPGRKPSEQITVRPNIVGGWR
jgi:hypothetical protein